jgi:hypothetical protein
VSQLLNRAIIKTESYEIIIKLYFKKEKYLNLSLIISLDFNNTHASEVIEIYYIYMADGEVSPSVTT